MADVFISYKSKDRARAREFVEALRSQKWDVWWDQDILPGTKWKKEILKQLNMAGCVVALWSLACVQADAEEISNYVLDEEMMPALRWDKLIPVILDTTPPSPILESVQHLSLVEWRGEISDPGFKRLSKGIEEMLAGKKTRPDVWFRLRFLLFRASRALRTGFRAYFAILGWIALKIRGEGKLSRIRAALATLSVVFIVLAISVISADERFLIIPAAAMWVVGVPFVYKMWKRTASK